MPTLYAQNQGHWALPSLRQSPTILTILGRAAEPRCMLQWCWTSQRCQAAYSWWGFWQWWWVYWWEEEAEKSRWLSHCTALLSTPGGWASEYCITEAKQTVFHRTTKLLLSFSGTQSRCSSGSVELIPSLGGLCICVPLYASHHIRVPQCLFLD